MARGLEMAPEPRLLQICTSFVAWSEWTKLGLVQGYEVPADKITVIPPGVNVHEWRRPKPRVPHGDPVKILLVGGDLERKGGWCSSRPFAHSDTWGSNFTL